MLPSARLLICSLVVLGCAQEANPGPLSFDPEDVSTPQPVATTTVSNADFQNQAFPYRYILGVIGEDNGGQAYLQRGVGRVELNDDLTVATVTIDEGAEPISVFRAEPTGNFFDSETATLDDFEILAGLVFSGSETVADFFASSGDFSLEGIVGFETPEQPGSIDFTPTYRSNIPLSPSLSFVAEGDEFPEGFTPNSDAMALSVDFETGDVTGQLFSGLAFVDYDGDFSENDQVAIVATLEGGRLENAELRGEVSFAATIDRNGNGDVRDFPFTVNAVDLQGHLYGDQAQALGLVYSGEGSVLGPDGNPIELVFGGISIGEL